MQSNADLKSITLLIVLVLCVGSIQAYAFGATDDVDQTAYVIKGVSAG